MKKSETWTIYTFADGTQIAVCKMTARELRNEQKIHGPLRRSEVWKQTH